MRAVAACGALVALFALSCSDDGRPAKTDTAPAVFEGITPCDPRSKPLPQIPDGTACEMTTWRLTFAADRTFVLQAAYGVSQPNTTGMRDGGTKIDINGTWVRSVGTSADPHATVITLNGSIQFVRITDDLIHLLDPRQQMMIGNAAWSYTLNRTGPSTPQLPFGTAIAAPSDATRPPGVTAGVFEGRTPCTEVTNEFTKYPTGPQCQRIKWRLSLDADGTYLFRGTETQSVGTWKYAAGELELDPGGGAPLRLRATDTNHLYVLDRDRDLMVGDAILSYTLSRVR